MFWLDETVEEQQRESLVYLLHWRDVCCCCRSRRKIDVVLKSHSDEHTATLQWVQKDSARTSKAGVKNRMFLSHQPKIGPAYFSRTWPFLCHLSFSSRHQQNDSRDLVAIGRRRQSSECSNAVIQIEVCQKKTLKLVLA